MERVKTAVLETARYASFFFSASCFGCPVAQASGHARCAGTPFEAWASAQDDCGHPYPDKIHDDETAIAAVLELEFLKSLLRSRRK